MSPLRDASEERIARAECLAMDEAERRAAAERERDVATAKLKERTEPRVPWVGLTLLSLAVQGVMQLVRWAVPRFDLVDAVQALDESTLLMIVTVSALCGLAASGDAWRRRHMDAMNMRIGVLD